MPMNRQLYPPNWEAIALAVKVAANWTCQECGRPCRLPGEARCQLFWRISKSLVWCDDLWSGESYGEGDLKLGRFTLTVAHLNHQPSDCSPENLRALCAPCHCRYDLAAMAQKRALKAERQGQLILPL